ncbi:MAG: hypothetical protein ABF330_00440 [Lentimonas sp.]
MAAGLELAGFAGIAGVAGLAGLAGAAGISADCVDVESSGAGVLGVSLMFV